MKAKNYFLPAGDPKGTGSVHIYGGTVGGPDQAQQGVLLRERRANAAAHRGRQRVLESGRQRPAQPADDGDARGKFRRHGHRAVRSAHRRRQRHRARAVRVRELSGLTSLSDPQFDACNYIPANRINPIAKNFLSKLVAPTLPGFTNNYFATNSYDTDYNKYDGKITWTPNARVIVNGRLGYADSYEDSAPEMPSIDGGINPIFQGRIWDSTVHSHSLAVTSTLSPTW